MVNKFNKSDDYYKQKQEDQDQVVAQMLKNSQAADARFHKKFMETRARKEISKAKLAATKARLAQEAKAKESKSSKKETKKDLKKLFKEVKGTKMPSAFDPEIESMKEKLKEISSLMSKPKKELKSLVKANEEHLKVFPSMKDKEEQKMTKQILKQKVVKAKASSSDDLHKKIVKYVKGQIKKGTLESMEQGDIFYIAEEAISKGVPPRLSLKFIKTIIDE